jgi:hypothetical protein
MTMTLLRPLPEDEPEETAAHQPRAAQAEQAAKAARTAKVMNQTLTNRKRAIVTAATV